MDLKRVYLDDLSNHIKIGIIGATNVGKSTLFNILIKQPENESLVDNSLFTTIDPCATIIALDDPRMHTIQSFLPSPRKFNPLKYTVVDTAALLTGAFREVIMCSLHLFIALVLFINTF
jgi:ribosome-binding ATPase YchF (GTP1/OBG family)